MTRKEEIEKASVEYQLENKPMAIRGDFFDDEVYRMNVNPSFIAGAEWADKNPVHYDGKAMLYVLHKGVKQGKQEMLEEVCKYIKEKLYHAWINTSNGNTYRTKSTELFIKNLKKAMEGKHLKD